MPIKRFYERKQDVSGEVLSKFAHIWGHNSPHLGSVTKPKNKAPRDPEGAHSWKHGSALGFTHALACLDMKCAHVEYFGTCLQTRRFL